MSSKIRKKAFVNGQKLRKNNYLCTLNNLNFFKMGFYFFHTPKPRQFNYIPRYFDPEKEALEKKKAAMGLDSKLSEAEKRRMRIRRGFGYSPEEMQEKKKFSFNSMRHIVLFGLIGFITYVIFGTPLIENFIEMFLSLGK